MKTAKSLLLLAALFFFGISYANAQGNQKFAFVDSDYILQNIPEYGDAQEQINQLSIKWEKEIKELRAKLDELKRDYQTESILLTDEQKRKKEEQISTKEQEIVTLQMQYFGPEGQLFTKRAELIQPIQEKIYNAINQMALLKNYAFVFDKASGTTILYCNEKNDISDDVLDEIGNVMQTVRKEDRKRSNSGGNGGGEQRPAQNQNKPKK